MQFGVARVQHRIQNQNRAHQESGNPAESDASDSESSEASIEASQDVVLSASVRHSDSNKDSMVSGKHVHVACVEPVNCGSRAAAPALMVLAASTRYSKGRQRSALHTF